MLTKKSIITLCIFLLILLPTSIILGYHYFSNNTSATTQSPKAEIVYVNLGQIIVNLSPPDSQKYFKAEISVGYDEKDSNAKKQLTKEKQLPIVKDIVNFYFKSKSYNFISNSANEKQIKNELMDCINNQLSNCKVIDIRFSKFILQ
ncbi:hypothetical protein UT300005_21390 [Clostridium sp. CTA-5]